MTFLKVRLKISKNLNICVKLCLVHSHLIHKVKLNKLSLNCQFSKQLNVKYRKFNEEKRSTREVFECVVKWKEVEIQCKTLLVSTSSKLHFMYGYYNFSFNYSGIQILSTSPQKWNFSKKLGFQQNQLSENGFWSKLSRCIKEWFMDLDIEMLRQSYTGWKLLKILKSQCLSYSYNYLFAISQQCWPFWK